MQNLKPPPLRIFLAHLGLADYLDKTSPAQEVYALI